MKKRMRQLLLIIFDILAINVVFFLALYIRFDGSVFTNETALVYLNLYLDNAVVFSIIKVSMYAIFRMYHSLWRYASVEELFQVVLASVFATVAVIVYCMMVDVRMPRSIIIISIILDIIMIGGIRFSYRSLRALKDIGALYHSSRSKRILIIGAGDAGAQIVKEIRANKTLHCIVVAIIDDDTSKNGRLVNGVPVIGGRDQIVSAVHEKRIDCIIIAIPSATRKQVKELVDICTPLKVELKIIPSVGELIEGKIQLTMTRNIEIQDLLGRDPVKLDIKSIGNEICGKRIMVSGGGGSIGSEICRQVAKYKPSLLLILDIYENGAYDLEQEMKKNYPELDVIVRIGSVCDKDAVFEMIKEFNVDIIYHAAAHKHVPLMESSPREAVKNNIFGTWNIMRAAHRGAVTKFVQISTDKAVNPTNVMGATKRVCEMMAQSLNKYSKTEFIVVRFGNVLGSNGSVVPLFKKQIAAGGPITVTDPEIIRYFMTIPEACSLVIQAGAIAEGGEVFILDMGEPVRIVDLAKNLIRLSGYEPEVDIKIVYTGLRPGEKLYEELLVDPQLATSTKIDKIFIEKAEPLSLRETIGNIQLLKKALKNGDSSTVDALSKVVPTFVSK